MTYPHRPYVQLTPKPPKIGFPRNHGNQTQNKYYCKESILFHGTVKLIKLYHNYLRLKKKLLRVRKRLIVLNSELEGTILLYGTVKLMKYYCHII